MLTTMFRQVGKERYVVCGHLNKQEVAAYKQEGWTLHKPNTNKNGIPVERVG